MLTKEALAATLTGREYGGEITKQEEMAAKDAGFVVVFGYSDDNIEFRGAIHDEQGAFGGTIVMVDAKGVLPERDQIDDDDVLEDFFTRRKTAKKLEALWCEETPYSWTFKTDIPHATFEITENGESFCRGIVFALEDLKQPQREVVAGVRDPEPSPNGARL